MTVCRSELLAEVTAGGLERVPGLEAVVLYGSRATSPDGGRKSDIDVLFVGTGGARELSELTDLVCRLSRRWAVPLDREVPYENKLLASLPELEQAATCEVFSGGIEPIRNDLAYLSGRQMRERLLVNILSGPSWRWELETGLLTSVRVSAQSGLVRSAQAGMARAGLRCRPDDVVDWLIGKGDVQYKKWLGFRDDPDTRRYLLSMVSSRL